MGRIARLIARLITPMRARPVCARPSATMARKVRAAEGQCAVFSRQCAKISLSARISASTLLHFVKSSPVATGTALRPNGSARAGDLTDGSARSTAAIFDCDWVSSCA